MAPWRKHVGWEESESTLTSWTRIQYKDGVRWVVVLVWTWYGLPCGPCHSSRNWWPAVKKAGSGQKHWRKFDRPVEKGSIPFFSFFHLRCRRPDVGAVESQAFFLSFFFSLLGVQITRVVVSAVFQESRTNIFFIRRLKRKSTAKKSALKSVWYLQLMRRRKERLEITGWVLKNTLKINGPLFIPG